MKKQIFYCLILLIGLFTTQLEALSREFEGHSNEYETYFCYDCVKFFEYFGKRNIWNEFDLYLHLIPTCDRKSCERCKNLFNIQREGIYAPYVCAGSVDNFEFLQDHLLYCARNSSCQCYWPEKNTEAAFISDCACKLFIELFKTTALSILVNDEKEQKRMLLSQPWNAHKFSHRGLVIALTCKSFFYSHFYRICKDLDQYSKLKFNDRDYAIIQDKIENILEDLAVCYLGLYKSCKLKHQNQRILKEYKFISQLFNIKDEYSAPTNNIDIDLYDQLALLENKSVSQFDWNLFSVFVHKLGHSAPQGEARMNNGENPDQWSILSQADEKDVSSEWNDCDSYLALNQLNGVENDKINQKYWLNSQLLLGNGIAMNDLMLYQTAISRLTAAIKVDSTNVEAYIERAFAYFETNQLSLALQDYKSAKKLVFVPPLRFGSHKSMTISTTNKTEFSKGLVSGTVDGATVSTIEFVPSLFSCCRGIFNGLWAFVCSPLEVSQEVINTTYAIGEFISIHSAEECFQCVVPELKELSFSWNKIDDYLRGQKIGYIIGKYGVDIFAPVGALKGVNKVRALKRANTMCTLENCAVSEIKQAKILEESIKRASIREQIISDSIKSGKILVKNSNTQVHIIQPKHAWDKLIEISGNIDEDCKKVVKLLEDNQILLEKHRIDVKPFKKTIRYEHQIKINEYEVKAIFNRNLETNELFLNDAWVITR